MRALTRAICAGVVLLGLTAPATASTPLYNNGLPDQAGGNESTQWIQAEDFTLTTAALITDVRFWSLEFGAAYQGTISWAFYSDAGSNPGAVLYSGASAATHVATGNTPLGATEFQNDFSVGSLAFGPGTYWLGLHNGPLTTTDRLEFYWETTGGIVATAGLPGVEDQAPFDGVWASNGAEHAFQLFAGGVTDTTVPEPASMLLLGTGLAAVVLRRRFVRK